MQGADLSAADALAVLPGPPPPKGLIIVPDSAASNTTDLVALQKQWGKGNGHVNSSHGKHHWWNGHEGRNLGQTGSQLVQSGASPERGKQGGGRRPAPSQNISPMKWRQRRKTTTSRDAKGRS